MIDLYMPDTEIWTPPRPAIIRAAGDLVPPALAMPFMPGFLAGPPPLPVEPAEVTFLGAASDTVSRSTYTFSDQPLGEEAVDRYIVVGMGGPGNHNVNSVTVGGESATQVVSILNSNGNLRASLFVLSVPSGTAATVVVALSADALAYGIGLWRMTGIAEASPHATAWADANLGTHDVSLNVPSGGVAIGYGYVWNQGVASTWSGVDQAFDELFPGNRHHGGQQGFPFAGTPAPVTVTPSGPANRVSLTASWAKAA